MTRRRKTILTAVAIGFVISLCLTMPIGAVWWINDNPSIAEVQEITGRMSLTDEQSAEMDQMVAVGYYLNLIVSVTLMACPAVLIGSVIGLIVGIFRANKYPEEGIEATE